MTNPRGHLSKLPRPPGRHAGPQGLCGRFLLGAVAVYTAFVFACKPTPKPAEEIIGHLEQYLGRTVTMTAKVRSGARCKARNETGEWQTYCKDCQVCAGPLVVDSKQSAPGSSPDDWPMILGGSYEGREVRCRGPLNKIACHPLTPGKHYVLRGKIENEHPPKLLLSAFWSDEPK